MGFPAVTHHFVFALGVECHLLLPYDAVTVALCREFLDFSLGDKLQSAPRLASKALYAQVAPFPRSPSPRNY